MSKEYKKIILKGKEKWFSIIFPRQILSLMYFAFVLLKYINIKMCCVAYCVFVLNRQKQNVAYQRRRNINVSLMIRLFYIRSEASTLSSCDFSL